MVIYYIYGRHTCPVQDTCKVLPRVFTFCMFVLMDASHSMFGHRDANSFCVIFHWLELYTRPKKTFSICFCFITTNRELNNDNMPSITRRLFARWNDYEIAQKITDLQDIDTNIIWIPWKRLSFGIAIGNSVVDTDSSARREGFVKWWCAKIFCDRLTQ